MSTLNTEEGSLSGKMNNPDAGIIEPNAMVVEQVLKTGDLKSNNGDSTAAAASTGNKTNGHADNSVQEPLILQHKAPTLQDILDHSTNSMSHKNIETLPNLLLPLQQTDIIDVPGNIENNNIMMQKQNKMPDHMYLGARESHNNSMLPDTSSKQNKNVISIDGSEQTSATVKMFQRMDELSVRMIAMEETLQTLCNTVNQQNSLIVDMKDKQGKQIKGLSTAIGVLNNESRALKQIIKQNSTTTDQDTFVTDLLNSITNVSSTYLRKIKKRSDSISQVQSPFKHPRSNTHSDLEIPKSASHNNIHYLNNLESASKNPHIANNNRNMHISKSYSNFNTHFGTNVHNNNSTGNNAINTIRFNNESNPFKYNKHNSYTFTLNPNGIKKRKRVHTNNGMADLSIGHTNLNFPANLYKNDSSGNNSTFNLPTTINPENVTSLKSNMNNGLTDRLNTANSTSLPNLTLDSSEITNLLKPSNMNLISNDLDNFQSMVQQSNSVNTKAALAAGKDLISPNNAIEKPIRTSRHASIELESSDGDDSREGQEDEEDDGYQEDDDDDNDIDNDNDNDNDNKENDIEEGTFANTSGNDSTEQFEKNSKDYRRLYRGRSNRNLVSLNNQENSKNAMSNDQNIENKRYTLLKAPNSVRTIWEEYIHGINGNPAIKDLEEKFGNKWRKDKNRKTFARRKRLYKFILKGVENNKTAEEMIAILEKRRLYTDDKGTTKRRTIGWLQQSLSGI